MTKYELSKYDFEAIDEAIKIALRNESTNFSARLEQLKDKFAKAHTGWLEMEDE